MTFFCVLNIHITIALNSTSDRLLAPISLSSFSEINPIISFGVFFFFCLTVLAASLWFLFVLDRSAVTPSLHREAFCSRCPVESSGAVCLITWPGCSGNVPCVGPLVVIEPWWLLACSCMRWILRLADCEAQPWPRCVNYCARADRTMRNSPLQGLLPAKIPLGICFLWSLLDPPLMFSIAGHWVYWFWASWEVLWCRPMWDATSDWPLPTCLELPAIHSLWLLLLGLGACGKDPALHQGWLLPAPDLGADPQKSSGTLVRPVCLSPLLAAYMAQSLKEAVAIFLSSI